MSADTGATASSTASAAASSSADTPALAVDPQLTALLRQDLLAAQFTNDRIEELLGPEALAALDRDQLVPGQLRVLELLRATGAADPAAVLAGLWLLGMDLRPDQVEAALPRLGVSGLQKLGLVDAELTDDAQWCRPRVELRPYQAEQQQGVADLWVTSDLSAQQVQGPLPTDHVLGIGRASLTLAAAIHRRRVRTALEIGTGCGIQLLHMLDHVDHVVATDLSARALNFTHFNLLLNAPALRLDLEDLGQRVELLQGSLFEPVAGRRFDLIVSNPPFVITPRPAEEAPEDRYTYRDGGRRGDLLMQEIVTALPEFLTDSGTAQMLGNWEIPISTDWDTRPQAWCADFAPGQQVDAWFIQRDQQDISGYAETWLRDASTERDPAEYQQRYAQYLADFSSRDVEAVGFGMIWLRRRSTSQAGPIQPWRRFEEITGPVEQPLGPVIGATVARATQASQDPASVWDSALVVAADVTEERHQRFGAIHPEVIIARQGSGMRRSRPVSSAGAGLLGAADGEFTAAQLITAVAALMEESTDEPGARGAALRDEVTELYVEGYLTES